MLKVKLKYSRVVLRGSVCENKEFSFDCRESIRLNLSRRRIRDFVLDIDHYIKGAKVNGLINWL